jgi:hypothetical protein
MFTLKHSTTTKVHTHTSTQPIPFLHLLIFTAPNRKAETWGEWSEYGSCTSTCGVAFQTRSRVCENVNVNNIDEYNTCIGIAYMTRICYPSPPCARRHHCTLNIMFIFVKNLLTERGRCGRSGATAIRTIVNVHHVSG